MPKMSKKTGVYASEQDRISGQFSDEKKTTLLPRKFSLKSYEEHCVQTSEEVSVHYTNHQLVRARSVHTCSRRSSAELPITTSPDT